ncbi:hypothetical protein SLS58_011080 [Diplodia intermedia]|uniref:F-box domain-containing protein n=1 Tax=Diplodia intermedia TaxID=856260 RepID=A0ABR3T1I0_9PEZI
MDARPAEAAKPFRLLDLPAELRLRIYEHALTAPDKTIRIYYSYQQHRTNPNLSLPLLRTCRQIHAEARDILCTENTVFVHADVHRLGNPVIGASQLPPAALSRLRRLFVVLDLLNASQLSYDAADFRPFQAMVRLRHLRIAAVDEQLPPPPPSPSSTGQQQHRDSSGCTRLLSRLIERVPARCALDYAAGTAAERAFVAPWCSAAAPYRGAPAVAEVPRDVLVRAAAYSQAVRGCKSGDGADWRLDPDAAAADPLDEVRTW